MNKKILMIEDNPDHEELTRIALEKKDVKCDLVVLRDGAEALDYILTAAERADDMPDIILMDLKLPKIDGLEVLKYLKENGKTKHIPVVIMTSSDEDRDVAESYKSGASSYIQKPVDFEKFCEAIHLIGEYWLQLNKQPLRVRC